MNAILRDMSEQNYAVEDLQLEDDQKKDIVEIMKVIEDGDFGERDMDLELVEAVLDYLDGKTDEKIENVEVVDYDEEEVENLETVYEDDFLAVTKGEEDEETGEKDYTVWVRGDYFD